MTTPSPLEGPPAPVSRRRFLQISCAGLGAAALACAGFGYLASRPPALTFPESLSCGDVPMKKILVVYASRCGSTAEIAAEIGKTLCQSGAAADVQSVKDPVDLSTYQAVVIGSAVRFGAWLPEAVKFVETNAAALKGMPLAYFAAHLMNQGEGEPERKARLAYLDAARKLAAPQAEAFFTGVGDMSKVSFLERMIGRMVKTPEGDFRSWDQIRAWAKELSAAGFAG